MVYERFLDLKLPKKQSASPLNSEKEKRATQ